ncbi:transcriptional repressor [Luteimonas sp. R10]|uniref:transcriptional repressor n=1 Tax=Luteimonas sp. R10 TaxID=3108176 RepID=UPI00308B7CEA|nr:transcriptional repressor [Luteimonas sp. R10]
MVPTHACIDPKHHVHDAAGFVAAVEDACRDRGLRLTPIRAHVLGLIADAGRPLKAYDLLDQVREGEGPGAAAPPTVYRALDFLLGNGFIHKLESVNAFVACHHPSSRQHSVPFLICDDCQSATELEDERVVELLDDRARALGFVPQAQTLEVHGLCAECSRRRARNE